VQCDGNNAVQRAGASDLEGGADSDFVSKNRRISEARKSACM